MEVVVDTVGEATGMEQGVAEGDAVAEITGHIEPRGLTFEVVEEGLMTFVSEVVLGDGAGPSGEVGEGGRAFGSEEALQGGSDTVDEGTVGELGDLGVAGATGVGGEEDLAVGGATGEEGGGEQGAEDIEAFAVGDEGAEALAGMADTVAGKAEHDADHGDIGQLFEGGEGGEALGFEVEVGEVGGGTGEDHGPCGVAEGIAAGGAFEGPGALGKSGQVLDAGVESEVGT